MISYFVFRNICRVNDPVALKLLSKAGEMSTLEPPDDESIKTLYLGGLDARITEQDLRDNFYAHGEIESIRILPDKACAFITYTTREGAEKAVEELCNKLVVKGLRLKLTWGRPQVPKPELEASEEARQQALVAHSGLLPRAVISQQQNQLQMSGTQDQPPPMHYYNMPPPPPPERAYYPSMDPQRMGALVPSQDGGESKSGSDKQPQGQHYPRQAMPPPPPPPHGPYPNQVYPPYGYMPPVPPYQQYPPYHHPQPMPQGPPPPSQQHYQHSGPRPGPPVHTPQVSTASSAAPPGSAPPGIPGPGSSHQ